MKDILYMNNLSQSELARQLGMSQQSFSQMLSASDIKSSLLERIADVLGVKMSFFYPEDGTTVVASGDGSSAVGGDSNAEASNGGVAVAGNGTAHHFTTHAPSGDAAVLTERVKCLQALLDEKERTIRILMEGRK